MQRRVSRHDRVAGDMLRPEELGFGPLFWAVGDAVVVVDVESGRIVLWNPAAERLFGYSAEEAVGLSIEVLIPDRLMDRHRAGIAEYAATGHGALIDAETPVEYPARRKSGEEIFIDLSLTPLNDTDTSFVIGISRDATKRKRIEQEREVLLTSAQDHARRVGELATLKADFTAMVAHELATPVATIRTLADLFDREGVSAADRQHALATIRAQTHLLQRLVADIRDAATFERDDFAVIAQPTAVATLLAEAAASAQVLLAEHSFHVESAPIARVFADSERIGQVLHNLLGNAARHTPSGTSVVLGAKQKDGKVYLEVTDRGPGIHADDLSRIVTKFGRGRDAGGNRVPGVGLGLYLSRRIIQAHGGDLIVVSEPGEGATFSFALEEAP